MKVEFFVPLTIEHYKNRNFEQKAPVPNFNHDYILEQIETQRQNDLSEDDSEFYDTADLNDYVVMHGDKHFTYRKVNEEYQLFVVETFWIDFPKYSEEVKCGDKTITLYNNNQENFKLFVDEMIKRVNGDMSDGWGEGFEQHPVILDYEGEKGYYYFKPGKVAFVHWPCLALDNDKITSYIKYNGSNNDVFEHGWLEMGIMCDNEFCNKVVSAAIEVHSNMKEVTDYSRQQKRLFKNEIVDVKFVLHYIDYLIDKYNTKEYLLDENEIEYLKEYKEYLIKQYTNQIH